MVRMGLGTVLIIDDSAALRQQVDFVLTQLGYTVVQAFDSREGGRILEEERMCLLIIGCSLTESSMEHFLQEIRKSALNATVPILFLNRENGTTHVESLIFPHMLQLTTPFSSDSLEAAVHKLLPDIPHMPEPSLAEMQNCQN